MRPIPEGLRHGPFTHTRAHELGVSERMLRGARFRRIFPRVWVAADHEMTDADWIEAARLTLPKEARMTGVTRIQQLGLDFAPRRPLHFVLEGDLHLVIDEIFLHRTKRLAPHDDRCVTAAAAFLFYCSHARVIDAIKVGDWLLHWGHITIEEVRSLALSASVARRRARGDLDPRYLDPRSRSLKESETRAVIEFAGLPRPEVNVELTLSAGDPIVIVDLLFEAWGLVVEYEGEHHQNERLQYSSDIGRYEVFRRNKIPYLQVTHERLTQSRKLVLAIHQELISLGYNGPAPAFGERWRSLFRPIRETVGSRDEWLKAYARGAVG